MNTNRTTLFLILYTMVITLLVGLISLFGVPKFFLRESLNISCTSNYFAPRLHGNMSVSGTMTVYLGKKNKGMFNLSGVLEQNQEGKTQGKLKQIILREILFNYSIEDNGYITINNPKVFHTAQDKISDDLFNLHIFDFSRASRQLKITRVSNAWLLGTSFSPAIMCVDKT